MVHHLQHIVDLVEICRLEGIEQVVVSPGSRNAPLIKLFANNGFKMHSIVDERSAAFYGLGIAQATQKPVALICTSGTAVLNYGPAIAEAYYQRIPLIAITADRPENLIDQQDNQTIRQTNVFRNYIKDAIHLNQPINSEVELSAQHLAIHKLLKSSVTGIVGPVHINVPIAEPFYIEFPEKSSKIKISLPVQDTQAGSVELKEAFAASDKIMVICGQNQPSESLNKGINALAGQVVVLAEPIANIRGAGIINEIDRMMMSLENKDTSAFEPDLLISYGGPVVSKRLKIWLQKQKDLKHYRIAEEEDQINTYGNLTKLILGNPIEVIQELTKDLGLKSLTFLKNWESLSLQNIASHNESIQQTAFSDLNVFETITNQIPDGTILHLGNSSPVRYGQLFDLSNSDAVYSNRGVSGIDGCLSTAAGFASQNEQLNLLVIGDLSFLYDSNGLWNSNLPNNLKIVLINNEGGGIFRLIPGPSAMDSFEEFMETKHPVDISKLTAAFGVDYFTGDETNLKSVFEQFLKSDKTALLEVNTPRIENATIYQSYINRIKNL